jgi:molybdate transport system ATP-binding protein
VQPELLLLDEPLAANEAARRDEVLPYLERLRDRYAIPILYVSHDYDEVLRLASYIVLLADGTVAASGTPGELGEDPVLRRLIGSEAVGAVLEATVTGTEADGSLTRVAVGTAELRLTLRGVPVGTRVRLNVLARDVILSLARPEGLSVRNAVEGTLTGIVDEGDDAVLATVSVGEVRLYSRITRAAVRELELAPGQTIWALVKAVSLRGHAFARGEATAKDA